jgi:hypothetical protein
MFTWQGVTKIALAGSALVVWLFGVSAEQAQAQVVVQRQVVVQKTSLRPVLSARQLRPAPMVTVRTNPVQAVNITPTMVSPNLNRIYNPNFGVNPSFSLNYNGISSPGIAGNSRIFYNNPYGYYSQNTQFLYGSNPGGFLGANSPVLGNGFYGGNFRGPTPYGYTGGYNPAFTGGYPYGYGGVPYNPYGYGGVPYTPYGYGGYPGYYGAPYVPGAYGYGGYLGAPGSFNGPVLYSY